MFRILQINTLSNEENQHCEFCSIRATHNFFDMMNGNAEGVNYSCEPCLRRVQSDEIEVEICSSCRRLIVPNDRGRCLCDDLGKDKKEKQVQTDSINLLSNEEKQILEKIRNIIYRMGRDFNPNDYRDLIDKLDRNEKGEKINIYGFPHLQDIPSKLRSLDLSIKTRTTKWNAEQGLIKGLENRIKILEGLKEDQEENINSSRRENRQLRNQLEEERQENWKLQQSLKELKEQTTTYIESSTKNN